MTRPHFLVPECQNCHRMMERLVRGELKPVRRRRCPRCERLVCPMQCIRKGESSCVRCQVTPVTTRLPEPHDPPPNLPRMFA